MYYIVGHSASAPFSHDDLVNTLQTIGFSLETANSLVNIANMKGKATEGKTKILKLKF